MAGRHTHLHGLATAIHEISGLEATILKADYLKVVEWRESWYIPADGFQSE